MDHLTKPLREGYAFNYNTFFKSAWNLMSKEVGTYIGMTILFLIITFTISWIPYLSILGSLISYFLYAGFYIFSRNLKNRENNAADFFKGFLFAGNITLYAIVYFLLMLPLLIPLMSYLPWEDLLSIMSNMDSYDPVEVEAILKNKIEVQNSLMIGVFSFLLVILGLYLAISYAFVLPLIVDAKLNFWQAMELSRKTIGKRFFTFLAFWIIIGIAVIIITIITCAVGLLFVLPFIYCLIFEMYDQIFDPYPGNDISYLNED